MAKNKNRVSINSIDKAIESNFTNYKTDFWRDIEVEIKHSLSLEDVLSFVDSVVTSCFNEQNGYMPEVKDFAIKSNILSNYTNVSLPDNLTHRYNIIYQSDIIDFVYQHINMVQLQEIVAAIDKKLSVMCNANVADIQRQLIELVSTFDNMQKQTQSMLGDITSDDISSLLASIGNGNLEEKIVEAYIAKSKDANGDNGNSEKVE